VTAFRQHPDDLVDLGQFLGDLARRAQVIGDHPRLGGLLPTVSSRVLNGTLTPSTSSACCLTAPFFRYVAAALTQSSSAQALPVISRSVWSWAVR
jgi:hypothetical protein